MKIKLDLTTNSSNQSFVMSGGKKPIDVAKEMLEIHFNNWRMADDVKKRTEHPREKRVMKWIRENLDFEGNVIIPWTCNYPTFIFGGDWIDQVMGRKIIVDTCNNEPWKTDGLDIEHFLDPSSEHNDPNDEFLDLTDFKLKNRTQFNKEEHERFEKEIAKIKKRKEKKKEVK